jgi:hypothetical protein
MAAALEWRQQRQSGSGGVVVVMAAAERRQSGGKAAAAERQRRSGGGDGGVVVAVVQWRWILGFAMSPGPPFWWHQVSCLFSFLSWYVDTCLKKCYWDWVAAVIRFFTSFYLF